jgi:hypothetical protein
MDPVVIHRIQMYAAVAKPFVLLQNWMITRANMILAAANKTQTVRFWTGLNNLDPTTSTYTWADKSPVSALVT